MKREISVRAQEIDAQFETDTDGEFLTHRKYKDDLEWWILGRTCRLLRSAGRECPTQACKSENPDFDTWTNGSSSCGIEIGEILTEGRRRGDEVREYNECQEPQRHLVTPLDMAAFDKRLSSKCRKRYGEGCWLVLYHNEIFDRGLWFDTVLKHVSDERTDANEALKDCPFSRVLVLNHDGEQLVEVYPEPSSICVLNPREKTEGNKNATVSLALDA